MSFAVAGDAYDRFMGRHSRLLAPLFADFAGVATGPVLEVGCGPGILTEVLASRLGGAAVSAVEPSAPFAEACRRRVPGADVRVGDAQSLPFEDGAFAAVLSQLVISFVPDPSRALAEAVRVSRPGGVVAACMWRLPGIGMLDVFWEAVKRIDPGERGETWMPLRRDGELRTLWQAGGLSDVVEEPLDVTFSFDGFEAWWQPFTFGVGPPGSYLAGQPEERRALVREACRELLGDPRGPFTQPARALAVRGTRSA